jgi:hypothetical protein
VLPEQPDRLVRDLEQRRPVANGPLAGDPGEDARRLLEDLLLLVARAALEPLVQVAVVADLVAATMDVRHDVRPPFGRPARNEPGGGEVVLVEEVQQEGHADLRAVGALRHDGDAGLVRRVAEIHAVSDRGLWG